MFRGVQAASVCAAGGLLEGASRGSAPLGNADPALLLLDQLLIRACTEAVAAVAEPGREPTLAMAGPHGRQEPNLATRDPGRRGQPETGAGNRAFPGGVTKSAVTAGGSEGGAGRDLNLDTRGGGEPHIPTAVGGYAAMPGGATGAEDDVRGQGTHVGAPLDPAMPDAMRDVDAGLVWGAAEGSQLWRDAAGYACTQVFQVGFPPALSGNSSINICNITTPVT
jgi:hypothetical protein